MIKKLIIGLCMLLLLVGCSSSECYLAVYQKGSGWDAKIEDYYCENDAKLDKSIYWKRCNEYGGIVGSYVDFDRTHWSCNVWVNEVERDREIQSLIKKCENAKKFNENFLVICDANSKLLSKYNVTHLRGNQDEDCYR